MITSSELKPLKMYSKNTKFLAPVIKEDTKRGSAIFLLTPTIESTKKMLTLPYMVNKNMIQSYYVEKGIHYIMSADKTPIEEAALSSKERNDLPNGCFGIPELRKYPLNDEDHVRQAIQKFNYVDPEHEKELAKNINKAIKRFGISGLNVGDDNRFRKYLTPIEEVEEEVLYEQDVFEDYFTPEYRCNMHGIVNNEECIYIANDTVNEALSKYDAKIKKIIYADRIRNVQTIRSMYNILKTDIPKIKYTYYTIDKYKGRNLFIDTSFYNNIFINNNTFKLDKGVDLYLEFMTRLIDDSRLTKYKKKTVLIPIEDWKLNPDIDELDYKASINPISVIYRCLKRGNIELLKQCFKSYDVIFCGEMGYFRVDFSTIDRKNLAKFSTLIHTILSKQPVNDEEKPIGDSKDAIAAIIYTNIKDNTGISFSRKFTGDVDDLRDTDMYDNDIDDDDEDYEDEESEEVEQSKTALKNVIDKAIDSASTVDDVEFDEYDSELVASLINDIASETGTRGPNISASRASRISTLDKQFVENGVANGVKVSELLKDASETKTNEKLEETELPIESINEDWKHLKFMNFEKSYNLDADIVAILRFFSTRTYPVSVLSMNVEDTSNSENYIHTWTVQFEDSNGTRFTMKFDVPKFINGTRFMRLRGNDKTINGQLMNIPVIKTGQNTCQITSNYNKIFIEPYGSASGKTNVVCDRLMKALLKNTDKKIKIEVGDNSKLASKYELPIDYVDLGGEFSKIILPNTTIYFNQDELYEKYGDKIEKALGKNRDGATHVIGFPIGVRNVNGKEEIIISFIDKYAFVSNHILDIIVDEVPSFKDVYDSCSPSVKYQYSKCSILNTKIPLVVVASYSVGLSTVLNKGFSNKNDFRIDDSPNARYDKNKEDVIRFKDGSIIYRISYQSSMLLNGLKECNTEDYSIKDMDNRAMWTDFLDIFGGRIKADGLDNFYDLMVDPITQRVCGVYGIPDNYIDQLLYANTLLSDTKFNKHTDINGNRFRTNELVAAYTFHCLAKAYSDYSIRMKKTGSGIMSLKQSAIIDAILADNTTSDLSTNSDLSYVETANTVSFKGLSGLNCDRSYGIDKRAYDDSMLNVLAMSTGFAGNVGVNRNTTIDMGVESSRGYINSNNSGKNNMSVTNTLSISEALMPMSSTRDDPFRLAMSFIQNSKHGIASAVGDPCLVTTGADDALPYLAPDVFNYKAKADGKILEINERFMILQYKDGTTEVIELHPKTYKNSDGGFYLSIKLNPIPNIRAGMKFKANTVLAYDPRSYSPEVGYDNNPTANRGILGKVAFEMTDEGYEDSGLTSEFCSKALSRKVTVKIECPLDKGCSVYNMVKVGQHVEEGENLLVYQNAYDDEDVNTLLRKLTDDAEEISELGKHPKKAKVTGDIVDIQIYRTCELDDLSPTLKKIVSDYEKEIEKDKKFLKQYDPEKAQIIRANYKLDSTGKLKNIEDGVLIEFYLEFITDFGAGDKLVVNGGNKCVTSSNIEPGKEAYSSFRPDEPVDLLTSINSNNARMITSNLIIGLCNKAMVELDRQVKAIMGHHVETDIHEYLHPEMVNEETRKTFKNRKK